MFFFALLLRSFFPQNHLIRKILPEIPFVSNSLDPDQAPPNVGTELGPSCLQRLSADNTSRQMFNKFIVTVGSIPPNTSKCIELSFISDYNLHIHMSKHDILSQSMNCKVITFNISKYIFTRSSSFENISINDQPLWRQWSRRRL